MQCIINEKILKAGFRREVLCRFKNNPRMPVKTEMSVVIRMCDFLVTCVCFLFWEHRLAEKSNVPYYLFTVCL